MTTRRGTARRPAPSGGAARRITAWDDQVLNVSGIAVSGTTGFQLMENAGDPEKRGCTVVRVIVGLTARPDPPGAVSGMQTLGLGICTVSDDAFAGGNLPDPLTDADYPVSGWMWRYVGAVVDETLAGGPVPPLEIVRDLKVMRKVDRSSLVLVVETAAGEGTTFSMRLHGLVRVLYKLP